MAPKKVEVEEPVLPDVAQGFSRMLLKKHYRPASKATIIGHQRPARTAKNAAGEQVEVEPARFVEGEMYPPPYPGVGYDGKIWANTIIDIDTDEAKAMYANGIAERGF